MGRNPKKKLTLLQIAELSGFSKSTVSRVLTNDPHVSPETRDRVQAAIEKSGYRPNLHARGLRGGPTGQIAVIGRWMERGFIADVIRGIDDIAKKKDAHLLSCFAHSADDYIELWRRFAQSGQVDGTILIAPPREILLQKVEEDDVPVVLCACTAPKSRKGWKTVDSVTLDNRGAIEEVMIYLVEEGCRKFLHLGGTADIYETQERAEIFTQFIERTDGLEGEIITVAELREWSRDVMIERLSNKDDLPDAIVCFNDTMALGVLDAARILNLSIPRDFAVTGFDGTEIAEMMDLTTIHVPAVQVGQEAARLLCARLDEDEEAGMARHTSIELEPQYRESSNLAEARGVSQAFATANAAS